MLQPRKQKYRKQFRGKMRGEQGRGNTLNFGEFGLKSTGRGWLKVNQVESARKAVVHHTKRKGKLWIRVLADKPVTKKGAGVRMGGGKGDVDHYVAVVRPGKVLLEMAGVDREIAKIALAAAAAKLPFKTIFIEKL